VRKGIFGGTFDPIHFGHIHAIAYSLDEAKLDNVHVVVAGEPYQKNDLVASADQRLDWVRLSLDQHFPKSENVFLDDREVRRDGPSYTIDTISEIRAEYPKDELVLVVGEDLVERIDSWKDSEKLLDLVEIFVVPRTIFPTSSSYIRSLLRDNKTITGLVPSVIESEIIEKSLYN